MPEEATKQRTEPDAIVVGAGVIGLTCAWRMARRGLKVRVVERDRPGAGASSVAAGMIAPVGESSWGEEELLADALSSHRQWPEFARELAADSGRDPGLRIAGALHVALDRDEAGELRRRHELMSSLELDARWLRSKEARRLEPALSPDTLAAIHAPAEASIEPKPLLDALLKAAIDLEVEICSGAGAAEAIIEGDRLLGVVDSRGREHRALVTVLATGAWSGALEWLPEHARPRVRPVKGQIVTLRDRSGQPPCRHIVSSERVYLVPRADGRLVVGATVEEAGFDTVVTAGGVHELLREAYRAMPEVAEMELVATEAGLRPGTADNAPLVGEGELDGLILATGHYRHGVLLAPLTGSRVAAAALASLRTEEVWAG